MDWNQVFSDPDFQALPQSEKRLALKDMDPDFGELPDNEIDKAIADLSSKPGQPNLYAQVAKQGLQAALPSPEFDKPLAPSSSNPVMAALQTAAQTFRDPTRVGVSLDQPGKLAGEAVTTKTGSKLAGFGTELALSPSTYALGPAGDSLVAGARKTGNVVLDEATGLASTLSNVKKTDIYRLLNNTKEILMAKPSKVTGKSYGALKTALGVTEAEEKLIAKAGDRTPGVARSVAEGLEETVKTGKATLGELIAARRAAVKVAQSAKGSEKALYAKDAAVYQSMLRDRAEPVLNAIKEVAKSKTKEEFMRVFPRTKSNSAHGDYFRSIGTLLTMGATSPLAVGGYTLAAKGLRGVGNTLVNRPVGRITSATIANYLRRQQNGNK